MPHLIVDAAVIDADKPFSVDEVFDAVIEVPLNCIALAGDDRNDTLSIICIIERWKRQTAMWFVLITKVVGTVNPLKRRQ